MCIPTARHGRFVWDEHGKTVESVGCQDHVSPPYCTANPLCAGQVPLRHNRQMLGAAAAGRVFGHSKHALQGACVSARLLVSQADGQQEILPYIAWLCPGSWYIGVIAVQTTGKRNKPLWVWKKLPTVSSSPARFEDAVAVWGYRVRRLCPSFPAIALPPDSCTSGGEPNFRNEAPQEMKVLSVCLLFVSFCCVGTLLRLR
jgi:hypothetical protein